MPASLNPFRTLVQHRNFRLFWMGQTLSLIGTWMQTMAQGWLALELTNNAFYVGLVATVTSLPILVFSLHAGVLVDRQEKLRLVKAGQVLFCVQAAVLWWVTWTGRVTIGWLLALALANGLINAFEIPARQSLVIELVGREDLPGAIALNSSGFNLARVVGPSIGALIIAQLGIAWCFGVNAISYVAVLIGLFMIRLPEWTPPTQVVSPSEGILEGIRYMRSTPSISGLMSLVTVYSVLGVPYLTLMPVVAKQQLHLGAAGYGALLSCVGIGGLAGALGLAAVGNRVRRGVVLSVSSLAYGVLLIAFSLVRTPGLAYPLLLLIGFTMIVNSAIANATLQHLVPNELRGRMMAAYSFVVVGLSQVLGSFVGGAVAGVTGAPWAIGGAAVIMLVFAYAALVRRPELRTL
ncbi:MAG TPA: MFS transporter [Gemmatimonadaceae bacterium]|nr:MFS transporter [Gemmatimonadaceae bacterium]